jgi:hypothetical protein
VKKTSLRGNEKATLLSVPVGFFVLALTLCVLFINGGSTAFARTDGDGGTVANKSTRDDGDAAARKTSGSSSDSDATGAPKSADPKKGSTDPKKDSAAPSTEDQLLQLNEKVRKLEEVIEQQQKAMEALQNQMKSGASAPASIAVPSSTLSNGAVDASATGASAAQPVTAAATTTAAAANGKGTSQEQEAPLQIHIGSATIQPIGFVDFTGVFRSTNQGSGIGTNFGNIPFSNSQAGNLTEFRFSPQNSRLGARFDADVKGAHVMGYFENDFLGFVPTNAPISSNSYTMRIRLAFVDVRKDKFEIIGGQTWSLMTPNRNGLSPLPSDVFYSQDMDTNYQVGLTWARQAGVRFIYHASDDVALGFSLENPEQYIGGGNGAGTSTLPSLLAASTIGTELDSGTPTLTTPNVAPDVIAKIAFDPHVGEDHHLHIEFVGLERNFKDYNPLSKQTFSATGGGGAVNLNLELFKGFHLISNNFYGDGGGRYIFGQAPDLVLRGDGSISLIHSFSGVEGIEAQANPNTLLFAYYGGAYIQKNVIVDPATNKFVGYGFPGSSTSNNRAVQEATFGLNQTFWKDPKYGALALILQYSYLIRSPWVPPATGPTTASSNLFWIDLRYVLPGSAPKY